VRILPVLALGSMVSPSVFLASMFSPISRCRLSSDWSNKQDILRWCSRDTHRDFSRPAAADQELQQDTCRAPVAVDRRLDRLSVPCKTKIWTPEVADRKQTPAPVDAPFRSQRRAVIIRPSAQDGVHRRSLHCKKDKPTPIRPTITTAISARKINVVHSGTRVI
jgi:hypothetical protein